MNPRAKAFFEAHPDAEYWYYSANIRIPNPKFVRRPDWRPRPWPDHPEVNY